MPSVRSSCARDADGLRRYVHLGTGNYNSRTARLYEDLGFITCDPVIGEDATQLFNHLTGYSRAPEYQALVVAPHGLRTRLLELIAQRGRARRGGAHRRSRPTRSAIRR